MELTWVIVAAMILCAGASLVKNEASSNEDFSKNDSALVTGHLLQKVDPSEGSSSIESSSSESDMSSSSEFDMSSSSESDESHENDNGIR